MSGIPTHRWRFSRSGGFDQAVFETAEDFAHLEHLDQKLWAALACPVKGLEFDERTLSLIDTDNDSRVRAPEVVAAVQWCEDHLKDLAALKKGSESLPLAQINDATPAGRAILASAKQILKDLGKSGETSISVADAADTAKIFAQTKFNGDGVVPVDAADDDATKKAIEDVIACAGPAPDRSGRPGIDQAKLDAFFAECAALDAWMTISEKDPGLSALGAGTAAALDAVKAVRAKADDYFARCRVAAFDPRALAAVNRQEEEYLAIAAKDMSVTAAEMAGFPIAHIAAGKPLPLTSGINPAWEGAIGALRAAVVVPVFGKDKTSLTSDEWTSLGTKLAAYEKWLEAKPVTSVDKLGIVRIRELLSAGSKDAIAKLIGQDMALAPEAASIGEVERLVRYYRDLNRLLCNFVNFSDFYSMDRMAVFQAGVLYLDGRACELCVHVHDGGKHATLAGMSKAYLAYCDLTRVGGEKATIAAAFTAGDSDYLMVGRNGVFYDRKGRDWDATITRVVENPISVRQAFWYPYKKLVRLIEEMAAKRAAAAEAAQDAKLAATGQPAAGADKPPEKPPEPRRVDPGTVAAISVAIAGIGTLIATLVGYLAGVFNLPFWQVCLVFAGLLLLISTPSMAIAWLKLRQRNLGPILDANGWAINGRVKMNVPFGRSLTEVAKLPPGSLPGPPDPYGEKKSAWPGILKFVVIVCFVFSLTNYYEWIGWGLQKSGVKDADIPHFINRPGARAAAEAAEKAKADAEAKAKLEAEAKAKAEAEAKAKAEAEAKDGAKPPENK